MPLYFSAHTTACLTKQALRVLMKSLLESTEVKVRRSVCSQLGGRMVVETEAPDQKSLESFFAARNINCEWVMRIDLDARDDQITDL